MGADEETAFWHHQIEQERYRAACEAIDRCAAAGADVEDLMTLARECGIDLKHTTIGSSHAKAQ